MAQNSHVYAIVRIELLPLNYVKFHWLDILVLLGYLAMVTGLGWYFSKKNQDTEAYFLGGRSFSGWVVGLSLVGTSISSVTFLAYPADAYKTAWLRYLLCLMLPVGVLIAAYVFLPFFRRGKITSAYEYLEERFGPSIRVYMALSYILTQTVRVSIILYLVSLLVHEMTGLDPVLCILLGGVFVAFYTVAGGIEAVIWTDVIQTIILVVGGLLCLIVIVNALPGGLGQIFAVGMEHGKFAFSELKDGTLQPASWKLSFSEKTASMMLLLGLMSWLGEYSGNQSVIQRYCASRSTREARKAMLVCVCSSLPIWGFYMFLGTSLFVFFQEFPTPDAMQMLDGTKKAEQVLPYFVIHYLPPGITGLVIAAALAAAMSSLDSSINSISTVGIVDIYRRHLVKGRPDKHYLKVAWIIAVGAAVVMILGAIVFAYAETKTIQDTSTKVTSIIAGGSLSIYLLGFFTRRGDARAVGMGIVFTILFTLWTIYVERHPDMEAPFDLYYTALIGNAIMFAVGYFASFLLPSRKAIAEHLTVWKKKSNS